VLRFLGEGLRSLLLEEAVAWGWSPLLSESEGERERDLREDDCWARDWDFLRREGCWRIELPIHRD
jgi:hypothetical protein